MHLIDDEDLLLLQNLHQRNNPVFPYWRYEKFDLDTMDNYECKAELRLWKNVYILLGALRFPDQLCSYNGAFVDSVEAWCIFLRRVAYPCRYGDLVSRFARPVPQLTMITTLVVSDICDRFGHHLRTMDQPWLSRHNVQLYANAVHARGAALDYY